MCTALAPERFEHLKGIALSLSICKQADEPAEHGVLLLRDIRDTFGRKSEDRITTYNLLQELSIIDESPWSEWNRGRGLDARGLARLLKPFLVSPHNIRFDESTIAKGYERVDFEEAWATYLPADAIVTPPQTP